MRNTVPLFTILLVFVLIGCSKDNLDTSEAVRIRIANSGSITLNTVIVDNLTFLDISPNQQSEYQIHSNEIGLPPSYFSVKTAVGERAVIYDYVQGATLEDGYYTYSIEMQENGDIVIEFPPD